MYFEVFPLIMMLLYPTSLSESCMRCEFKASGPAMRAQLHTQIQTLHMIEKKLNISLELLFIFALNTKNLIEMHCVTHTEI